MDNPAPEAPASPPANNLPEAPLEQADAGSTPPSIAAAISDAAERRRAAARRGLLLSLSLLAFSVGLYLFIGYGVIKPLHLEYFFKHAHVAGKIVNPLEHFENLTVLQQAFIAATMLMIFAGAAISLSLLIVSLFVEPISLWFMRLCVVFPQRPAPAITLIDYITIFVLVNSVTLGLYAAWLLWLPRGSDSELVAAQLLARDAAMSVALFAAACIARVRASSWRGARGFWTAWSAEGVSPAQALWQDALLGMSCFFLSRSLLFLTGILYKYYITPPDDHFIVAQIAAHPKPWVLLTLIVSGTFGAAFFEETIYRGMLYNVLRRLLGGPAGAVIGAAVFASMHGFNSDLLSLFVLGLIMTWLYDKTGRLFAGMVFHFANNLFAFVQLFVMFY